MKRKKFLLNFCDFYHQHKKFLIEISKKQVSSMIREDEFDEETSEPPTSVDKEEEALILISKPELSSQSTVDENIISLE